MTRTLYEDQVQDRRTQVASGLQLPDAASTAAHILSRAMAACAEKVECTGPEGVADRLRQNDGIACRYCLYEIAKEVAAALGSLDEHVKAVYTFDLDATPEDLCFAEPDGAMPLIHLLVWTSRKTAAFSALVAALDRALAQAYAGLLDRPPAASLLDAHSIDDNDVETRSGYGVLVSSVHHLPIQVWER